MKRILFAAALVVTLGQYPVNARNDLGCPFHIDRNAVEELNHGLDCAFEKISILEQKLSTLQADLTELRYRLLLEQKQAR